MKADNNTVGKGHTSSFTSHAWKSMMGFACATGAEPGARRVPDATLMDSSERRGLHAQCLHDRYREHHASRPFQCVTLQAALRAARSSGDRPAATLRQRSGGRRSYRRSKEEVLPASVAQSERGGMAQGCISGRFWCCSNVPHWLADPRCGVRPEKKRWLDIRAAALHNVALAEVSWNQTGTEQRRAECSPLADRHSPRTVPLHTQSWYKPLHKLAWLPQ